MRRTNIYLDENQARSLDETSRAQGVTRAALIRRLIDRGLGRGDAMDLEGDLAAIEASFGMLTGDEEFLGRSPDDRARHLDEVGRRR